MHTPQARLATYRARATKHGTDWRKCRYEYAHKGQYVNHYNDKGALLPPSLRDAPGDLMGYVCPDSNGQPSDRNDKYGYYCDQYGDGPIMRAAVIRLRCPRGVLYIPATDCNEWDGATLHLRDAVLVTPADTTTSLYTNEEVHERAAREAGRTADHIAQREAETEREYQERERARDTAREEIDTATTAIQAARDTVRALAAELRTTAPLQPTLCATITAALQEARDTVRESVRALRSARRTLADLGDA